MRKIFLLVAVLLSLPAFAEERVGTSANNPIAATIILDTSDAGAITANAGGENGAIVSVSFHFSTTSTTSTTFLIQEEQSDDTPVGTAIYWICPAHSACEFHPSGSQGVANGNKFVVSVPALVTGRVQAVFSFSIVGSY